MVAGDARKQSKGATENAFFFQDLLVTSGRVGGGGMWIGVIQSLLKVGFILKLSPAKIKNVTPGIFQNPEISF